MENDFCTKVGMFRLFYQKGIKVPHGEKFDGVMSKTKVAIPFQL